MSIGENIKKYRIEKNLKQSELAERAGISRVAVGNYERGERTPNIDILKKIANALEIPISILTGENNVMNWFAGAGGLENNSKTESLMSKLNVTKLTDNNINSIRYSLEKDKIDLAITLLDNHGYKTTISENEFVTISDYNSILSPFNINLDTFIDFSKNLQWAIDSFINKFIDENSNENNNLDVLENEESIMYDIGNGELILAEYFPDYLKNQLNKPRKLDESEKRIIDKFGVGKGMHNRKK